MMLILLVSVVMVWCVCVGGGGANMVIHKMCSVGLKSMTLVLNNVVLLERLVSLKER
jgi:hypothetical protein